MKRKRYIKLLMGMGIQRNCANAMAYCCLATGKTYEDDYKKRAPWLRLKQEAHKLTVSLRFTSNYCSSAISRAAAAVENLRRSIGGRFL